MWLQFFAIVASLEVIYLVSEGYTTARQQYESRDAGTYSPSFSCGEFKNIRFPFKPHGSDVSGFPLLCQNNTTLLINLTLYNSFSVFPIGPYSRIQQPRFLGIYHVKKLDIDSESPRNSVIQILDPNFASNDSANSFCIKPRYILPPFITGFGFVDLTVATWVRCRKGGNDGHLDPANYLPLPCAESNSSSSVWHSYLISRIMTTAEQLDPSCQTVAYMFTTGNLEGLNLTSVWSHLQMGFPVRAEQLCYFCDTNSVGGCPAFCLGYVNRIDLWIVARGQLTMLTIVGITVFEILPRMLGMLFLPALLIYILKKKYSSSDDMEKLLRKCQTLMPRRYSYAEIKIITGHFREKLGQGGFGSVFKGSLFDGHPVAVKLLGKGDSSGRDFVNEVATIGRIHHVNIVRLVGFCSEGRTRALVYELMPNGSLDKYIFPSDDKKHLLSWEMLRKIALGIARGIEYLHQGCDMCILHFDIKPHNILLDENFCPKISDFGLAKLSPVENSLALSGYRGTIGYIAPEQVSRNLGGVSYKSDVYSFGMLLLKMAERTWNWDVLAPNAGKIYFPEWVYDRLSEGQDVQLGEAIEDEKETMMKLALVGLCCIQMFPANRPSMTQVIEMLEGRSDVLQLPPRAFLMFSDETTKKDCSTLSICQSGVEESTSYSGSKRPASSSDPMV
ncbi:unnamed protein product [Victoria cruziana]